MEESTVARIDLKIRKIEINISHLIIYIYICITWEKEIHANNFVHLMHNVKLFLT